MSTAFYFLPGRASSLIENKFWEINFPGGDRQPIDIKSKLSILSKQYPSKHTLDHIQLQIIQEILNILR